MMLNNDDALQNEFYIIIIATGGEDNTFPIFFDLYCVHQKVLKIIT